MSYRDYMKLEPEDWFLEELDECRISLEYMIDAYDNGMSDEEFIEKAYLMIEPIKRIYARDYTDAFIDSDDEDTGVEWLINELRCLFIYLLQLKDPEVVREYIENNAEY